MIRLLFGTYWAPRHPFYAAKLLHHKNPNIIAELSCAKAEADFNAEAEWQAPAERGITGSQLDEILGQMAAMQRQLAATLQDNAELRARLGAAVSP